MGKKVQPPPTPDFAGIAQQQGAANAEAARVSGRMSNPNVITPYGSQTVTWGTGQPAVPGHWAGEVGRSEWIDAIPGGDSDQATIRQNLTPAAEQTIAEQQNAELNMARFANQQAMPMLENVLTTPFTFASQNLPQRRLESAGPIATTPNPNAYQNVSGANYGQVQGAPELFALGRAQGGVASPNLQTNLNLNGVGVIQPGQEPGQYGFAQRGPTAPQLRDLNLSNVGDIQKNISPIPDVSQTLDESGVAAAPIDAGTTAQQAIMSRLQPDLARQRVSTETQLINQGLRPGGEAYNNAIDLLGRQENDARIQAILQGLGLDLSANQQGFGQAQVRGQFGNQAQQQRFNEALQAAQFGNAAQQQDFMQRVQAGEFGNAAQLASFGAGMAGIQLGNQAVAQNFSQGRAAQQDANAAQQQAFQQRVQSGEFGNAAQLASFGANLENQQAANAALNQNQQAALAEQQAANQAQAQGFANAQTVQAAQNAAMQQNFGNQLTAQQAANAAQQQQYQQLLQSAQFGNAAQQQALAQLLQERQIPLNEVAALLSGSQVQNPQFQAFQGQTVAPAPVFQAGQAQAGWDQNVYNQQVAQKNALTQGLFSLGSSAIGAFNPLKKVFG